MEKTLRIGLISLGVLTVLGLAYYYLIYLPSQPAAGPSVGNFPNPYVSQAELNNPNIILR